MADLFHRVSIRKFKDEAVSNEDIGYILEAAMAAPSAKNQQPWEFYVVENREVLKTARRVQPVHPRRLRKSTGSDRDRIPEGVRSTGICTDRYEHHDGKPVACSG